MAFGSRLISDSLMIGSRRSKFSWFPAKVFRLVVIDWHGAVFPTRVLIGGTIGYRIDAETSFSWKFGEKQIDK